MLSLLIRMHNVYRLTIALARIYFRDVKHSKRLTVVTIRERIGQIFKVAGIDFGVYIEPSTTTFIHAAL